MFLFMCSLWIWHEQLISLRQRQQKTGRLYNDLKKKHNYWNRSELISVTGNRSVTWSDGGFTISILKIPFCPHHQIGKSWFSVVPVFCYCFEIIHLSRYKIRPSHLKHFVIYWHLTHQLPVCLSAYALQY